MPTEDVDDAVEDVLNTMVDNVAKGSVPDQIMVALVDELVEDNERKEVEIGLQRFNAINANNTNNHVVCETIVNAIQAKTRPSDSIKMYCNPTIGLLSDFAPHYKMLISVNGAGTSAGTETIISNIELTFSELLTRTMFPELDVRVTPAAPFMGDNFKQISLVLWIGKVFHVPIFTAYVVRDAFDNAVLESNLKPIADSSFQHNAKLIANYNRVDVLLELLLHSEAADIYDPVNVLVARGIHALIVSKFDNASSPNAVIADGCGPFFDMVQLPGLKSVIVKMMLIAVLQDPSVRTAHGDHFSDIFPSGQYGKYFGEVAHRATTRLDDEGPIMVADGVPLTRTDIIVAAITAMNAAMMNKGEGAGETPHMVISGGAGVSYYIQEFLTKVAADPNAFQGSVDMGIDMAQLKRDCMKIKMNDIDCIVFGDVSRQFLSVFSLYMMVLYDNFFARPKRYGVAIKDSPPISFPLSASGASDRIDMHMYGNRDDDSNTMLISKRLRKEPKVQLVTQKTKCFSQIAHPLCDQTSPGCKEDEYYLEPIDLVKKTMEHFVNLYMRSLYPKQSADTAIMEKIATMLKEGYSGNLVSLKVMMLDIICIFCDEGASLFCRIFMARKNPKDFARLRVFIDIYLLQLVRSNRMENAAFMEDVRKLRDIMTRLNTDYYLEQGSIAAFKADMAEQLNARRDEFLGLLREVGRAIVDLDAPTEPVPAQFQKAIGESTIQFFKESPQIKYKFDMSQHMAQLFEAYTSRGETDSYNAWLTNVFETILFAPKVESVFREKLATILSMDAESNYEINFKDMPTRSPYMLELLTALKNIHYNDVFIFRYKLILGNLLKPLKEHIKKTTITPSAMYVGVRTKPDGLYDETTKALFPGFARALLLGNKKMSEIDEETNKVIVQLDDKNIQLDDAVSEEIGRILLEYAANVDDKRLAGGGSTRKRKRVCRLNAKSRRQSNPQLMSNKRSTRRKRRASNPRCKRTRRNCNV